jgi:hypothetical protein
VLGAKKVNGPLKIARLGWRLAFVIAILYDRREGDCGHVQSSGTHSRERAPIDPRPSKLGHMENSSWRHMDDLHCAQGGVTDQGPSLFERTIRQMKAGINELEEANIVLRRLHYDA